MTDNTKEIKEEIANLQGIIRELSKVQRQYECDDSDYFGLEFEGWQRFARNWAIWCFASRDCTDSRKSS